MGLHTKARTFKKNVANYREMHKDSQLEFPSVEMHNFQNPEVNILMSRRLPITMPKADSIVGQISTHYPLVRRRMPDRDSHEINYVK